MCSEISDYSIPHVLELNYDFMISPSDDTKICTPIEWYLSNPDRRRMDLYNNKKMYRVSMAERVIHINPRLNNHSAFGSFKKS